METIDKWEAWRPAVLARQFQFPPVNSYEDDADDDDDDYDSP